MKFIHLTDPHIVPEGQTLYGLDPATRLAAAIADINAHHSDAALAVLTGDLTDKGDAASYARFRHILSDLAIPSLLLAGNHDDREMLCTAFPEVPATPTGYVQYVRTTGIGRFVAIDTVDAGASAGHLCADRLDWLRAALDDANDEPVFLFMHHPPLAIGIPDLDDCGLRNGQDLGAVLRGRKNIRHLFFGHVHRPVHGVWQGIPFSALPSTNHQSALALDRLGGILDNHEPPAYSVVLAEANGDVVVHGCGFLDESPRFFIGGPDAVAESVPFADLLTLNPTHPK